MSDSQTEDNFEDQELMPDKPALKRQYKMTAEARESRIKNLALGREKLRAKREKLQAKKKAQVVVHEEEDSDSSESDEEYVIKKRIHDRPKQKGGASLDALQDEIQNLKKMLKKKTVVNKTIVQMPSVAEKSTKEDEKTEAMRQRLFKMY
jgi:hypothetical protein